MAEETQIIVKFVTKLPPPLQVPASDLAVPARLKRYGLSQVINHLLALENPRPFDFIVDGTLLRTSLEQHLLERGISAETVVEIEYTPVVTPPETKATIPQNDWLSAVDGAFEGHLVSGSYDGLVRMWIGEGECSCSVAAHDGPVRAVAVIRESGGQLLVTGGGDQTCRLWRLQQQAPKGKGKPAHLSAELLVNFTGHKDTVTAAVSSPDGDLACSTGWDGSVRMWRTGEEVLEAAEEAKAIKGGKKKQKAAGGDVQVTSRTAHEEEAVQQLVGHLHAVAAVCWPETSTTYTGGWDHSVRQWDAATGVNTTSYNGSKAINAVAACPTRPSEVALGASEGVLRIWDPRSGHRGGGEALAVRALPSHSGWITCVSWSPASEYHLVTGSHDKSIKVWDIRGSIPLATVAAHSDKVLCTSWWGAQQIASGGADCKLHIYSMEGSPQADAED